MMTLTRYGFREWGAALVAAAVVIALAWWLLLPRWSGVAYAVMAVAVVLWVGIAAFFRSPSRTIPSDPGLLCSPADGVVKDIEVVEDFTQAPFTGKALRIGIFLSVLDVHVNRTPAELAVESSQYRAGRYLDARDPDCARVNEAMTIAGTASAGDLKFPLAIRQISGAIARRIVCPVQPGRTLRKGEIYGMIKFGSRTEIYLPCEGFEPAVAVGDRVCGGTSVIARRK